MKNVVPPFVLAAGQAAPDWLRRHPDSVVHLARQAVRRRLAIPLDALRWAMEQLPPERGRPEHFELEAQPPGLAVRARASFMGNHLDLSARVHVDAVEVDADALRLTVRMTDVDAQTLDEKSPISQVLASGAVDLSRPADLLGFLPKRPAVIAEAKGDRFVLDLLRIPKLAEQRALRRTLATLGPMVQVGEVATDGDWLLVELQPRPSGWREALQGIRG